MKLRLLFFGTPDFSVPSLQKLHADAWDIIGVVTQPDKPVGRKQIMTPSPVKITAKELGLAVFELESLKTEEAKKLITDLQPDVIVVVAYGNIIPPWLLSLPQFGCINIHPSLLPKYRGATPLQAPILNGDVETGVTVMLMDEELDHGPILANVQFPMTNDQTGATLSKVLSEVGAELLAKTLPGYLEGTIVAREQDHVQATFTKILTRDDGRIDWKKPAIEIERMVRAYNPWPGTWTMHGEKRLKIITARIFDGKNKDVIGTLWKTESGELAVACKSGVLILQTIQQEGDNALAGHEFIARHPKLSDTPVT